MTFHRHYRNDLPMRRVEKSSSGCMYHTAHVRKGLPSVPLVDCDWMSKVGLMSRRVQKRG